MTTIQETIIYIGHRRLMTCFGIDMLDDTEDDIALDIEISLIYFICLHINDFNSYSLIKKVL